MEIIVLRRDAFNQALGTLGDGIDALNNVENQSSRQYTLMRDGVIQRFEYCIDSFWKFLKVYLENYQKMSIESPSPRSVLRLAIQVQIMHQEEYSILLSCVSDRNLTSHTYNEEMAAKIQSHIPLYHATMKNIIDRIIII